MEERKEKEEKEEEAEEKEEGVQTEYDQTRQYNTPCSYA
jgi:hypothetical protein